MTHSDERIGRSPAIARVSNAEAERREDTDWEQIVLLYDCCCTWRPPRSPACTRAIAVRYAAGTRAAMAELDDLAGLLGDYHL
jgi:predicted RNA polymerase sigma factor